MDNMFCFANRKEWRNWLEKNFDKETYAWLTISKKGAEIKGLTLEEAVEEALCFGWIDGKLRRNDEETFNLRFSIRKANSVWSKINRERAEKLIASGQMAPAGLIKIKEAEQSGLWKNAYTNKTRDEIPTDLHEALVTDKNAFDNFEKFANTYRNMYIGWILSAKTAKTRKERVDKVAKQSSQNKKLFFE